MRRTKTVIGVGVLAAGAGAALAWVLTPWPASLLIRALFGRDARKAVKEMLPYSPRSGVTETLDVAYGDKGRDTTLDVFSPSAGTDPLPTVVWIHGGAWISGDKRDVRPYQRIIAARGFTAVSVNYSVSPETTYPTALEQLGAALAFIVANAADYRIDPDRIVIAGDSAGAQYTSQLAAIVTNPSYARLVGMQPPLRPDQLRGVVLDCGIYDLTDIPATPGIGGWGFRIALWAYLGAKDWSSHPGGRQMSTIDYVTADFPRSWISGGNADPLTRKQSVPLADRLTELGVPVTTAFYADDYDPGLPHEYQFHLDFSAARDALESMIAFLRDVSR